MSAHRTLHRRCLLTLALALPGTALAAQQYWNEDSARTVVRITTLKPLLKGEGNQFLSGSLALGGSVRVGKALRFESELPVARAGFDGGTGPGESSLQIGNLYLGIRHERTGPITTQFGISLPTAGDPTTLSGARASELGMLIDVDRLEAFAPKVLTVRSAVEFRKVSAEGFLIGAKLGSSLLVSTRSDLSGDRAELFADYGARVGYQGSSVLATASIIGRAWLTESGLSLGERTVHQLTGTVELGKGRVRPSVLFRLPLETATRDEMSGIVGIGVAVSF